MATATRRAYGAGLAYRTQLQPQILQYASDIDLLEVPTEDRIIRLRVLAGDPDGSLLRGALERIPGVAHGIHMSIGSVEPHAEPALGRTLRVLDEFGLDTFSEHLAYQRMGATDVHMFQAMPFEEVSARWVAAKYRQVRRHLRRPMPLENVSYYVRVPDCALDEAAFLTRLTELTDCRLLLDVTNIYNNATNHGYDPLDFIRRLPGHRVSQLHLAGGHFQDGMWIDSHSYPVMPPVWDLLHDVMRLTAADIVILERDSRFEPFADVMRDVRKARDIFYRHRPATPPPAAAEEATAPATPAAGEDGDELAALRADPEVEQLRRFQLATVSVIGDEEVGRRWREDPAAVASRFDMNDVWARRWLGCDRKGLALMQRKMGSVRKYTRDDERWYRQYEWSEWARQMGKN